MKHIIYLLLAIGLVGCGQNTDVVTIKGEKGDVGLPGQGISGSNGIDGYSVVVKTVANPEICGAAGGVTVYLALDLNRNLLFDNSDQIQTQYITCNGQRGATGNSGSAGRDGLNGTSCTVNKVGTAATITCGSNSVTVNDGRNGTNASGIYITEIVSPCGASFANHEVFLRLSNGKLIAVYAGEGNLDRLVAIAPGNYRTTDTNNNYCEFTVTEDGTLTNQRTH